MDVCGLSKARPIRCNDSPAFQRLHSSFRCAAESSTYFPWVIHTTFEQNFHIRWCCTDPLRSPDSPDISALTRHRSGDDSRNLNFDTAKSAGYCPGYLSLGCIPTQEKTTWPDANSCRSCWGSHFWHWERRRRNRKRL